MSDTCTIAFIDVGPRKLSWTATLPRPLTWHSMMKQIRKHQALMSSDVSFDENEGIYVDVLRRVGTWRVLPQADDAAAVLGSPRTEQVP